MISPYRYRVMLDTEQPITFDTPGAAAGYLAGRGYDLSVQPSPGIVVYTCGQRCAAILRVRPRRVTTEPDGRIHDPWSPKYIEHEDEQRDYAEEAHNAQLLREE